MPVHSADLHFIACTFAPFQLQTITIKCERAWGGRQGHQGSRTSGPVVKVQESALNE